MKIIFGISAASWAKLDIVSGTTLTFRTINLQFGSHIRVPGDGLRSTAGGKTRVFGETNYRNWEHMGL
jgi:hypothetical protein